MGEFKTNPEMHAGTLSDEQITNACNEQWLIEKHFDPVCVRQACYELRASNVYYELDRMNRDTVPVRQEISELSFILVKPKQLITIITQEELRLPPNVLGRVLTKGQLFSIGILPVNTYADPGFEGQLGITFANLSHNYIKISVGQAIAKIEFSKLRSAVTRPYSGQHGYKTSIWPIQHDMITTRDELTNDSRLPSLMDELEITHGATLATISRRIFQFERRLILVTIIYLTFTMLLIGWLTAQDDTPSLTTLGVIGLGIVSNVIYGIFVHFATRLSR